MLLWRTRDWNFRISITLYNNILKTVPSIIDSKKWLIRKRIFPEKRIIFSHVCTVSILLNFSLFFLNALYISLVLEIFHWANWVGSLWADLFLNNIFLIFRLREFSWDLRTVLITINIVFNLLYLRALLIFYYALILEFFYWVLRRLTCTSRAILSQIDALPVFWFNESVFPSLNSCWARKLLATLSLLLKKLKKVGLI